VQNISSKCQKNHKKAAESQVTHSADRQTHTENTELQLQTTSTLQPFQHRDTDNTDNTEARWEDDEEICMDAAIAMSQQLKFISLGKEAYKNKKKGKGVLPKKKSDLVTIPEVPEPEPEPEPETPFLQTFSPFQEKHNLRPSHMYWPKQKPNPVVKGPEAHDAKKAAKTWRGEEIPGYISMMNFEMAMQSREELLREIRDLGEKKQIAEKELYEMDFHIDYRLDSQLFPMGLKLLSPDDVGQKAGEELDLKALFVGVGQRNLATQFGQSLVDGKICGMAEKLMEVNSNIQNSKNYRAIASVNILLDLAMGKVDKMLDLSKANPAPFPPPGSWWWLEKGQFSKKPKAGVPTEDMPSTSKMNIPPPSKPDSYWKRKGEAVIDMGGPRSKKPRKPKAPLPLPKAKTPTKENPSLPSSGSFCFGGKGNFGTLTKM
jgi:hypothetical protein